MGCAGSSAAHRTLDDAAGRADSSAANRALDEAAAAGGHGQQQKMKRIRREGRALNNIIGIIEDDVQGQRGRVDLIREHPCETTTNYAGAVCLRCNLDAQILVRIPPLQFSILGPCPRLGRSQSGLS